MKYYKRLKVYKSSNCFFDPNAIYATSYNWWSFVEIVAGKTVFNDYRYSITTTGHQRKVMRLMKELKMKIDVMIECPKGLDDLNSAITWYEHKIKDLQTLIDRPKSQKAKNKQRIQMINHYMEKIASVKTLMVLNAF